MKLVCISDLHQRYYDELPEGDILVFAGDIMMSGYNEQELDDFNIWLDKFHKRFELIIGIPGNHDRLLEKDPNLSLKIYNMVLLNDSGYTHGDIKFWGSPITPEFCGWAFMRERDEIQDHWDLIPEDTDILITHGPPYGILDRTEEGNYTGCPLLKKRIKEVKPKYHIFGHIHGAYGLRRIYGTTYVNCSSVNRRYNLTHEPVVLDI